MYSVNYFIEGSQILVLIFFNKIVNFCKLRIDLNSEPSWDNLLKGQAEDLFEYRDNALD